MTVITYTHTYIQYKHKPSWLVSLFVFPFYFSYHDWLPLHSSLTSGVILYCPYAAAVTIVMTSSIIHCDVIGYQVMSMVNYVYMYVHVIITY